MPEHTANRLRWERVPILGNNPVFCFEARRLWTRRTILVLLALMLALALSAAVLRPALYPATRGPGVPTPIRYALGLALAVLPPRLSALDLALGIEIVPGRGTWNPYPPYVIASALAWLAILAGRYFLPALGAISVASDRAAGRLGPLLASRMSLRQIVLGKLMALALPLCVLMVIGIVVLSPIPTMQGMPNPYGILQGLLDTAGLFVGGIAGIWVGAATRKPPVATTLAIFLAGVVLPVVTVAAVGTASLVVSRIGLPTGARAIGPGREYAMIAIAFALQGLIFVALWFSTKRALARAAE